MNRINTYLIISILFLVAACSSEKKGGTEDGTITGTESPAQTEDVSENDATVEASFIGTWKLVNVNRQTYVY